MNFIKQAFAYFNGRVNIINSDVNLNINTAEIRECDAYGYYKYPNVIVINYNVLRRYSADELSYKSTVIATLIHELLHADQLMDPRMYSNDANYMAKIENACEHATLAYIINNTTIIKQVLGVDMSINKTVYDRAMIALRMKDNNYTRRRWYDHIFMTFRAYTNIPIDHELYGRLRDIYNHHTDTDIFIKINDLDYVKIFSKDYLMPIPAFSSLIVIGCGNLPNGYTVSTISIEDFGDRLNIDLQHKSYNIMCSVMR